MPRVAQGDKAATAAVGGGSSASDDMPLASSGPAPEVLGSTFAAMAGSEEPGAATSFAAADSASSAMSPFSRVAAAATAANAINPGQAQLQQLHHHHHHHQQQQPLNGSGGGASSSSTAARLLIDAYSSQRLSTRLRSLELGSASAADADAPECARGTGPAMPGNCSTNNSGGGGGGGRRIRVWGWLEPGSRVLPHILLHDDGVALGRGSDTFSGTLRRPSVPPSVSAPSSSALAPVPCGAHQANGTVAGAEAAGNARGPPSQQLDRSTAAGEKATATPLGTSSSSGGRQQGGAGGEGSGGGPEGGRYRFVVVPDGRVSRLHCIIHRRLRPETGLEQPLLEDVSSNGTFLNGERVAKGRSVWLGDGDRVSLVLSVSPLVEQYFVLRQGDPHVIFGEAAAAAMFRSHSSLKRGAADAAAAAAAAAVSADGNAGGGGGTLTPQPPQQQQAQQPNGTSVSSSYGGGAPLTRMATSKYTTADSSSLDDLSCQICLGTLRSCVALQPCGHNFCATCLSHHFAAALGNGQPLSCPLRCAPPVRVVPNAAVRTLVERAAAAATLASPGPSATAGMPPATPLPAGPQQGPAAGAGPSSAPAAGSKAPGSGSAQCLTAAQSSTTNAAAGGGGGGGAQAGDEDGGDDDDEEAYDMSPLCPLYDEYLPADTSSIKGKQLEFLVSRLRAAGGGGGGSGGSGGGRLAPAGSGGGVGGGGGGGRLAQRGSAGGGGTRQLMDALEALARCAWNDDDARAAAADLQAVECIVGAMVSFAGSEGVQCNGCLALMSLVRGEGDVCLLNQWRTAKCGGVEAIVAAMRTFRHHPMVQLSALLCLIPMVLENVVMQAHICRVALPEVLQAMSRHAAEPDISSKGLVLLGVMAQGDDAVHESIRRRQVSLGAAKAIATALRLHGATSDEALWSCLFCLAVLVHEGGAGGGQAPPAGAAAAAVGGGGGGGANQQQVVVVVDSVSQRLAESGLVPDLEAAMREYKASVAGSQDAAAAMIVTAGDFLLQALTPAARRARSRRLAMGAVLGVALPAAAGAALVALRYYARRGGHLTMRRPLA